MLNFIFANLHYFSLGVWLVFSAIVFLRAFSSPRTRLGFVGVWCNNIPYKTLIVIAISIHLLYGIFATWGQYVVWERGSDFTRTLVSSPLPVETPLPAVLESLRPLFSTAHGYFAFYAINHFFLSTIALLVIVGLFLLFLVARANYQPINFREGDIPLIVLALLIAGWPGVIVLLPVGFVCAILFSVVAKIAYGIERVPLPPAFLAAAPLTLLLSVPLLNFFSLYHLLKL